MRKYICFIYISLWCLYYLQGVVYMSGGLISRLLLLILMIITIYYFFYAHNNYRLPKVLRYVSVLVAIWTLYGAAIILTGSSSNRYIYLKQIYCSLLPVFPFYVFTKQGNLTLSGLQRWSVLFLLLCILQFYRYRFETLGITPGDVDSEGELTNNMGYMLLSLFPLIPVYNKKPFVQYVFIGIISYYIVLSMKRGAMLIAAISLLWFFFVSYKFGRFSTKQLWRVLLLLLLLFAGIYVVQNLLLSSDYFNYRLEQTFEGDSSGRDVKYNELFRYFLYSNDASSFLFGNGANFTLKQFGGYAHNDWLEIAINNGLWMVLIYLIYWIVFFRSVQKSKNNTIIFLILSLYFSNYFLRTFVSMSYSSIAIYASTALGFALAQYDDYRLVRQNIN